MIGIIDNWPDVNSDEKKLWREAAMTWRLPYWDWAQKQTNSKTFTLPSVLTKPKVRIYPPGTGTDQTVHEMGNPLWEFENPTRVNGEPVPFGDSRMGEQAIKSSYVNSRAKNKDAPSNVIPVGRNATQEYRTDCSSGIVVHAQADTEFS